MARHALAGVAVYNDRQPVNRTSDVARWYSRWLSPLVHLHGQRWEHQLYARNSSSCSYDWCKKLPDLSSLRRQLRFHVCHQLRARSYACVADAVATAVGLAQGVVVFHSDFWLHPRLWQHQGLGTVATGGEWALCAGTAICERAQTGSADGWLPLVCQQRVRHFAAAPRRRRAARLLLS